jgi:hypothetical protein
MGAPEYPNGRAGTAGDDPNVVRRQRWRAIWLAVGFGEAVEILTLTTRVPILDIRVRLDNDFGTH